MNNEMGRGHLRRPRKKEEYLGRGMRTLKGRVSGQD